MIWTPQQDQALLAVQRWLGDPTGPQVFRLFGWAGTGKSELARHLAQFVRGYVCFTAYTGKAALVMRERGCEGAVTIHQLIYIPRDKSKARLRQLEADLALALTDPEQKLVPGLQKDIAAERVNLARPAFTLNAESQAQGAGLIILDECSMVDSRVGQDLLSFGTRVLVLGDPFQLPPVYGAGFFTAAEPDIMLTDIRRQALDNPIVAMSKMVREEGQLPLGTFGSSKVIDAKSVDQAEVLAADALIVGCNLTRRDYNRRIRTLRGFDGWYPAAGDRIITLRNNYDDGLLNGQLWRVTETCEVDEDECILVISPEGEQGRSSVTITASTWYLKGNTEKRPVWVPRELEDVDYGCAITCHKAQGSQYDHLVLFDESWCFKEHKLRWQYTGLTRAIDRVTVVRL